MKKALRVWIPCLCDIYDIDSSEVRFGKSTSKVLYDKGGK